MGDGERISKMLYFLEVMRTRDSFAGAILDEMATRWDNGEVPVCDLEREAIKRFNYSPYNIHSRENAEALKRAVKVEGVVEFYLVSGGRVIMSERL